MAPSAQRINIVLNVSVIVGLVVCIALAVVVTLESNRAAILLSDTKALSSELRQSSDDLTRFIRTYTVTGNISYWHYFLRVIDIRNGVAPLPSEPSRNHWDLLISDGVEPRELLPPSALQDRFVQAGFTDGELALLQEAQRQSTDLIDLETVAYNAMNGLFRPSNTANLTQAEALSFTVQRPPNQTFAMALVHGVEYHIWKGNIMRPLDAFASSAQNRVVTSHTTNYVNSMILVGILAALVMILAALFVWYFVKIAGDAQTATLLNTMLPARVVQSVTVSGFSNLRQLAATQSKSISRRRRENAGKPIPEVAVAIAVTEMQWSFPVLYSEYLPMAWVGFTDLVSFTAMCQYTPAKDVIAILNEMFSLFDVEAANFGVEKIKTIGDAFMCAKLSISELHLTVDEGLKTSKVAMDGFGMIRFLLRCIRLANSVVRPADPSSGCGEAAEPHLKLRVGLHVGPVASGIVGFERPLYDLFGDTVNTAARLEASGAPNRIQVMKATLDVLKDLKALVECDPGERNIELKGIGFASTCLVCNVKKLETCDGESTVDSVSRLR